MAGETDNGVNNNDNNTTHPAPFSLAPPIAETTQTTAVNSPNNGPTPAASDSGRPNSNSSDGNTLNEEERDVVPGGSSGLDAPGHGLKRSANSSLDHVADLGGDHRRVSVHRGHEQFAALERRFSALSQQSQDLERVNTRRSIRSGFHKPEKVLPTTSAAPDPSDAEKGKEKEDFDLVEILRSGKEKSQEAGIKRKQVGVVWEDLEVIGAGGMKINIRNFSSAVMEQFMVGHIQTIKAYVRCPSSSSLVSPVSSCSSPNQKPSSTRTLVRSNQERCV